MLTGINPNGMGLIFSEIYTRSISDSNSTEYTDATNLVEEEHDIMSDKRFSIQVFGRFKGVYINRTSKKNNSQHLKAEVATCFDIAATHIYVEIFIIRCVCDLSILNNICSFKKLNY